MRLRRGDVMAHANYINREGAPVARLVIASTPIATDDELATVQTLHVYDSDPGGLLSVRVGDVGFASAMHPETTIRTRLGEVLHTLTADELEEVESAIRAAFFDL